MNSEAHEQCAQWIQQQFAQYGYQVELQKADLKGYDSSLWRGIGGGFSFVPIGTVVPGLTTTLTRPTGANQ